MVNICCAVEAQPLHCEESACYNSEAKRWKDMRKRTGDHEETVRREKVKKVHNSTIKFRFFLFSFLYS